MLVAAFSTAVMRSARVPGPCSCVQRNLSAANAVFVFSYYHGTRTHLGLDKDTPDPRPVQPPELGRVVAIPQLGGLHHRYERRPA